jgi:hypothetical protein
MTGFVQRRNRMATSADVHVDSEECVNPYVARVTNPSKVHSHTGVREYADRAGMHSQ